VAYPLDYLRDDFRVPAGNDKIYSFSIAVAHELVVVTGRIRAEQEFEHGKMLTEVVMDFALLLLTLK
jgi:hypothetical protein